MTLSRIRDPILCGATFTSAILPLLFWLSILTVKGEDIFAIHPIVARFFPTGESLLIVLGLIFLIHSRFDDWLS